MGEILLGERWFDLELQSFRCRYYLLVDMIDAEVSLEHYGVGILLVETGERAFVAGITPSESRISSLGNLLYRNGVTPCTLGDILADWL